MRQGALGGEVQSAELGRPCKEKTLERLKGPPRLTLDAKCERGSPRDGVEDEGPAERTDQSDDRYRKVAVATSDRQREPKFRVRVLVDRGIRRASVGKGGFVSSDGRETTTSQSRMQRC
jgi:hypothetical protein